MPSGSCYVQQRSPIVCFSGKGLEIFDVLIDRRKTDDIDYPSDISATCQFELKEIWDTQIEEYLKQNLRRQTFKCTPLTWLGDLTYGKLDRHRWESFMIFTYLLHWTSHSSCCAFGWNSFCCSFSVRIPGGSCIMSYFGAIIGNNCFAFPGSRHCYFQYSSPRSCSGYRQCSAWKVRLRRNLSHKAIFSIFKKNNNSWQATSQKTHNNA